MEDDSIVMQQYEVPLVLQPQDSEQPHPISPLLPEREAQPAGQSIRHCVEFPGQARAWVQELSPMPNTLVYTMRLASNNVRQQGTVEKPNRQRRGSL